MATRALPDLVARVRVDSSGVDQAMTSLVSSFGRANLALAGVAAGLGVLILGGKSMIDIAEKHNTAQLGLAQAYASAGVNLKNYQDSIDNFIASNRRYVTDQSEVIDGYAKLTRSGLTQVEVQKDMSRALDLAALKHISVSEAVTLLDNAEHGRMRGLIDLGITTGKYTDAQGNLIQSSHSVAQAMGEIDTKTKGGRDTLTETQKASNRLSNDWQDVSKRGGPQLVNILNWVQNNVASVYDEFDKIGKDNKLWSQISDRLVNMARWIHDWVLKPMQDAYGWLEGLGKAAPYSASASFASGAHARASGGPVIPGGIYTVGERGPETLVMGRSGGTVIPNAGGGQSGGGSGRTTNVYVTVQGHVMTDRELGMSLRETLRRLDREQR